MIKTCPRPGPASHSWREGIEVRRRRGSEAGQRGPGARRRAGRGRRGAAVAEPPRVDPPRPRVTPGPRARTGSTYPAWVVAAAAGARMPGVRHSAHCAAALRSSLPTASPAPGRTKRAPGGTRLPARPLAARSSSPAPSCPALRPALVLLSPRPGPSRGRVSDFSPQVPLTSGLSSLRSL